MEKKDKKKLLVLGLFLFAVIALGGYGVYSYYWTQGSFDTPTDTSEYSHQIYINGDYDPRAGNTSGSGNPFLGEGGTISLDCPDTSSGKETIECTGTINVYNGGSTSIDVSVLNSSADASSSEGISATAGNPKFNWTNITLSSSSERTLEVTVPVTISNGTTGGLDSDTPEEVHAPVSGGTVSASVTFKIEATQVH